MKKFRLALLFTALLAASNAARAQEVPAVGQPVESWASLLARAEASRNHTLEAIKPDPLLHTNVRHSLRVETKDGRRAVTLETWYRLDFGLMSLERGMTYRATPEGVLLDAHEFSEHSGGNLANDPPIPSYHAVKLAPWVQRAFDDEKRFWMSAD